MSRPGIVALVGFAAVVAFGGCSAGAPDAAGSTSVGSTSNTPADPAALSGELTIFAAASLTASFDDLADAFTAENPGVIIRPIVYDGSSTLATQLIEGASADVFAAANENTMTDVAGAGELSGDSSIFVTNTLQIAVAPGNPDNITDLADLADDDLLVVLCAPQVPCGEASQELFSLDGITVTPASEEQNVKAVLTKVGAGEADAGLVYKTDVLDADGAVDGVDIEGADRALNNYTIGIPSRAGNPEAAAAFVDFVLSDAGQKLLGDFGFGRP